MAIQNYWPGDVLIKRGPTASEANLISWTPKLSDDTTLSTLKPPPKPSRYNYENEMQMGVSLPLPDTLIVRSSNPRDWGNLFSPPVTIAENAAENQVVSGQWKRKLITKLQCGM